MREFVTSSEIGGIVSNVKTWNPLRSGKEEPFDYIDLSSIDQQEKAIVAASKIFPQEAPSRARQLVQKGDVLVSTVRPNLNGVAYVPEHLDGATASTGFCVLRPKPKRLDGRYLYHWVQTDNFINEMVRLSTGANYPAISDRTVKSSKIPLPPLPEQKRIAAILDKADAIRRKRQQTIKLADDFLRATFLDMFGDPLNNPKGWPRTTLGTLIKLKSGDFLPANKMLEGNIPVYGGNGINGYHNEHMFEHSIIVIGRVGVYCGAIHKTEPKSWVTDNALYVAEKNDAVTDLYLEWSLRMANLNQYASQAGQPLISGGRIYPVEINLPPMNLQKEFEKVQITHSEMKEKIFKTSDQGEELFNSLTQRAFRGEL